MHRLYDNGEISVFWDSEKCRHARECVTGCPEAFNVNRKPWIDISRAGKEKGCFDMLLCGPDREGMKGLDNQGHWPI